MLQKMILIVAGALLVWSASLGAALTGNFVTEVSKEAGPSAFVSVVTSQGKAIAYICDGKTVAQWYRGSLQAGGLFEARSTDQKSRITAQVNAGSVFGAITLETNEVLSFRATPANGEAGLYRSDDTINGSRWLGGWVVLPDGQQRGAVIGSGSTRPGRKLELNAGKPLPFALADDLMLEPFQVTPDFVARL
jgi:hypothetical protein